LRTRPWKTKNRGKLNTNNRHLHFQVKYDDTPGSIGREKGKSAKGTPQLENVTIAGRRFVNYKLPSPCVDDPPGEGCRAIITGKGLPLVQAGLDDKGGYVFEYDALGVNGIDDYIFIDPMVAVGYDYVVSSGPSVQSILLPRIGDGKFELHLFDDLLDKFVFASMLDADVAYTFPQGGVDQFRVLGIEADAGLDPDDPTAFVTGLTFTGPGLLSITQTPISIEIGTDIPEPSTLWMILGFMPLFPMLLRRRVLR